MPLSRQHLSLLPLPDTFSLVIGEGCVLFAVQLRLMNFLAVFKSEFPFRMLMSYVGSEASFHFVRVLSVI